MVLVRDEELGVLLPALGFPQTLAGVAHWRHLGEEAMRNGAALGRLIPPGSAADVEAVAVAAGAVLVLWPCSCAPDTTELAPLLRLLNLVFAPERAKAVFESRLAVATNSAKEIQSLAAQLDVARRDLERRVQERTAELRASIRELEGFSYSVAHDLRAPLRAIVTTSRMMEEDFGAELPEGVKVLLREQRDRALTLGRLIDDLLHFARLTRRELDREQVDLSSLAQEIGTQAIQSSKSKAVLKVEPGLSVYAEENLVRLALQNLLENAVKFSPDGGQISVGLDTGFFFIKDEGIGFENKYGLKIFQPFERLVHASEFPGTGIGLANVQRIIERHGGKVWAQSSPGAGTTFFFTFGEQWPSLAEQSHPSGREDAVSGSS